MSGNKNEIRNNILNTAKKQFFTYGLKITMDDIANKIGISKKTLYKFFKSKDALLSSIMDLKMKEIKNIIKRAILMFQEGKNVIDILKQIIKAMSKQLEEVNPSFTNDLQKFFPKLSMKIQNFRNEMIFKNFSRMIKEGIKSNIIRKDIDPEIITYIYSIFIEAVLAKNNPEFKLVDIFESIINIFFKGILTEEAKDKFSIWIPYFLLLPKF